MLFSIEKMISFFSRHKWLPLYVLTGAVGGYLYFLKTGCTDTFCRILSSPWTAVPYGAIFGGLIYSFLADTKTDKPKD